MRCLLPSLFLIACVPPAENDLLADSDRFDTDDPVDDFGSDPEEPDVDNESAAGDQSAHRVNDYTNEPYVDQEPSLTLTVDKSELTVDHAFASIADVDIQNQLSVEVSTNDVVAHYEHIFTEEEPQSTWHEITYTIDCSSMELGEHTLYLRAEQHNSDGTIESIEMDAVSFIIE